jgi:hypothetical protein
LVEANGGLVAPIFDPTKKNKRKKISGLPLTIVFIDRAAGRKFLAMLCWLDEAG